MNGFSKPMGCSWAAPLLYCICYTVHDSNVFQQPVCHMSYGSCDP
jgi:hypothetical protein